MLHPRPMNNTKAKKKKRVSYRIYVTLRENKLRWFGHDPDSEGYTHTRTHTTNYLKPYTPCPAGQMTDLASWHTVGLDNTIKIVVPVGACLGWWIDGWVG